MRRYRSGSVSSATSEHSPPETPETPTSPVWPVAREDPDGEPAFGCFPFPGSAPERRYSVALPAQHPGSFLLAAPVQVATRRDVSPNTRRRRRSAPNGAARKYEEEGLEAAVRSWRRRRRVTGLVDQLLIEIYGLWGGREGKGRLPSKGYDESSDYLTEWSSTSGGWRCSSSCAYQQGSALDSLRKARLRGKDVSELRAMVVTLEENVNYAGSLLVRQLKRRDALITKREMNCDLITAFLQAVSEKRSQDTRMRFNVVPPPPGDSGFEQWRDAMRMVARLPGGIPPEFRRRLWLTLAEKHLQSRGVDWSRAERMCLNEWRHPDDEQLGIQIVKDLHRTGCSLFCGGTEGAAANQAVLKRVLLGFARWNKAVGYCQGFNMLAALILQVTERSEADAIKVMIYLIEGVLPEGYFADHLRGLSVDMAVFRDLLRIRLPALSRHLETLQHDARDSATGAVYEPPLTNVFTMQWFLTLFCNCLPRAAVLRVWDLVFLEGSEVLLRTALAIWDGLQDRIMAVGSADEFYSIMGVLTREMLEFGLMDSNNLIKAIVSMGPFPFPGLSELRDRHLYNITPWSRSVSAVARRGLGRIFYAGEEEEEEEEEEEDEDVGSGVKLGRRCETGGAEREAGERLAVATAFGLSAVFRSPRRRDSHPPSEERGVSSRLPWSSGSGSSPSGATSAPPTSSVVDRERLSLDVWALRRQYSKLRERQRQAHVILTDVGSRTASSSLDGVSNNGNQTSSPAAACARQMGPSPSAPSHGTAVNHLLLGKSALLPPRGRRRGPPPGSVPAPLRRIHPPPPVREAPAPPPPAPPSPPEESGETLLWRDAKRRQGKGRRNSESGSSTLSPLNEIEDVKQELQEEVNDEDKDNLGENDELKWDESEGKHHRRRSRTYSSDSGSSSTELCDEDAARLSDLDSSGEGPSPVPPVGPEEDNARVYSPPKSPLPNEEPPPLSVAESAACGILWDNVAEQDNASKEGRLSSSTMTPGLDDTPLSPQETASFILPVLNLPPLSPATSTHVAHLSPSAPSPVLQDDSRKTLLVGSPQQLSPFSSPTTSSASEQSPATTSSPEPIVSTPTSSNSSPVLSSSSNAIPPIPADDSSQDVALQSPVVEANDVVSPLEGKVTNEKEGDISWSDAYETKPEESDESPEGLDSLLSKWSNLKLKEWNTGEETVNEGNEKSPTVLSPIQVKTVASPGLSYMEPETSQTVYEPPVYPLLLPSTSVSLPLPLSTSSTPPLDITPSPLTDLALSTSPNKFISFSTTPPPYLPISSSLPPLLQSSTPPPLLPISSSPPSLLPSMTPPPLSPSTTPPPFPSSTMPPPLPHSTPPALKRIIPSSSPPLLPPSTSTPPIFPPLSKPSSLLPLSSTEPPFSLPSTFPTPYYPAPSTHSPFFRSLSTPQPVTPSLSPPQTFTTPSSTPPPFPPSASNPLPLFTSSSTIPPYHPKFPSHPVLAPSTDSATSTLHSPLQQTLASSNTPPLTSSASSKPYLPPQLTKPFSLPSLPLHTDFSATCDTDPATTVKQRDRASLTLMWDWLPEEARFHKKTKSGSSPSSLLGSPDGVTSRTLADSHQPSSPPKVSPNLAPRRHSERALRIIQENSEILQRMLRHPPPSPPSSPSTSYPTLPERLHPFEGDVHRSLSLEEGGERSPHSPSSPASSSWALDTSLDLSASASSKSPASSPVALGDVISWGIRRGTLSVSTGGKLPSPTITSPPQPFNPFPQRASWRQPKELGVKLGLYSSSASSPPPTVTPLARSSPTTPTSPSRSSITHPKQTFK